MPNEPRRWQVGRLPFKNRKGVRFVTRRPCQLELQTMNCPKRTGNQRKERRGTLAARSKTNPQILHGQGYGPTYGSRTNDSARVAELADAVDSKSTDESLAGSTPAPGTSFFRNK